MAQLGWKEWLQPMKASYGIDTTSTWGSIPAYRQSGTRPVDCSNRADHTESPAFLDPDPVRTEVREDRCGELRVVA